MPYMNLTTGANAVITNASYVIANQPPLQTTTVVWIVFGLTGIALLLLSAKQPANRINDLAGILSSLFLFVTAIQSFSVDTITSNAFVTGTSSPYLGAVMTGHTIYHYDLWGVIFGIIFVISLGNMYLLLLDYRRVTEQETPQLDHMSVRPRSPASRQPRDPRNGGGEQE